MSGVSSTSPSVSYACHLPLAGEDYGVPAISIDNHSQRAYPGDVTSPVSLETLPRHHAATVAAIEWARLAGPEARRLRELGFDEGVGVEVLHRSLMGRGPIACRIGRMTVAIRRAVAAAIHVSPDVAPAE